MALRGYYRSDRHDDAYIESHLDLRDLSGAVVPGYGWIFPLGDGRVNVGVGTLDGDRAVEGPEHEPSDGSIRRVGPSVVGALAGDVLRTPDRWRSSPWAWRRPADCGSDDSLSSETPRGR